MRRPALGLLVTLACFAAAATIVQVSWKFSAATACARTVGDWLPLVVSAISGATQPKNAVMNTRAAPPKWAISAQVLSSALA